MAKRKMVQNNLLKNSIAAYFAAIEIHNKPNFSYRYETTTLLLMNAWELILKGFVKKRIKSKSIFTKDGHTISIDKAIDYTEEYINTIEPRSFTAIKENLLLIEGYRNNIVHYYNEQLEPYIFMLTAKAALNYVDFLKKYFSKDILAEDGLFILPLGFKLPFKPEDFLSKKATNYVSSPESKEFINSMVKIIGDLETQGVEDTIVVGFDIYLENVKRMKNSDLLIAITSKDGADASFSKVSKYQITNDSNAQKVNLSDEEIIKIYPLTHKDVCERCKNEILRFLHQAKDEGYYELFLLELGTGMRRGEILALKWSDLNPSTGELHIERQVYIIKAEVIISAPKTKASVRTVILPESLVRILAEYRKSVDSEWMFPSLLDNSRLRNPSSVRKRLQLILEQAGGKKVRFHDLRHTFATMALEHGMDVKTLSATIGHVSSATTLDIYSHITDTMQRQAAVWIDRKIGGTDAQMPTVEPTTRKDTRQIEWGPYTPKIRKPGTGCVTMINDHLYEGRYTPTNAYGQHESHNIYAKTREECEEKFAELIVQVKAQIKAEKEKITG